MKECPVCGKEVKGRSDRVYCSEQCKSAFAYEKRLANQSFYLEIDKALKHNRKILKKYKGGGFSTVRQEVLIQNGFNPDFFTHYWKSKQGKLYLFCYEFGFSKFKDNKGVDKYLLIEWQQYMKKKVAR